MVEANIQVPFRYSGMYLKKIRKLRNQKKGGRLVSQKISRSALCLQNNQFLKNDFWKFLKIQ